MEARANGSDYESALSLALPETAQLDELGIATFSALLAGYFRHYSPETLFTKIHPEVAFHQPLAGSRTFTLAGKIDGMAQLTDGRLAIKEDKTTSDSISPDSDFWLRLRFNGQLMQYILAVRPMGWDVACCIYDVTRKPAIEPKQIPLVDDTGNKIVTDAQGSRVFLANGKPRQAGDKEKGWTLQTRVETPDEFSRRLFEDTIARPDFYFARREVPIIEQDLDEFREQRLTLSRIILHCRQSEKRFAEQPERAWPRAVSEMNCRSCSYQSFCLQNLSVNRQQPPAGFKLSDPNPELSNERNPNHPAP